MTTQLNNQDQVRAIEQEAAPEPAPAAEAEAPEGATTHGPSPGA